jgi:hypothetical protein
MAEASYLIGQVDLSHDDKFFTKRQTKIVEASYLMRQVDLSHGKKFLTER